MKMAKEEDYETKLFNKTTAIMIRVFVFEIIGLTTGIIMAIQFGNGVNFGIPVPYFAGIFFIVTAITSLIYSLGIANKWWKPI